MKNTELFEILGGIDDKFYDEALGGDSERPMQIRIKNPAFSIKNVLVPAAACLAVAAGIGVTAHFLNRTDFIDPNRTTSSDTLSDVVLFDPRISSADIDECKELLRERYPDIEEQINYSSYCTVDIDFDGSDEFLILASSENSRDLIIFEKTANGMTESASVPVDHAFFLNRLYKYDSDGERYWYFYWGDVFGNIDTEEIMHRFLMQRIICENGEYSVDSPLCYGFLCDDNNSDTPKEWFFKTNASSKEIWDPASDLTPQEFKERWEKHADLPWFEYHTTVEEEYPMFDLERVPVADDPYSPSKTQPKAIFDIREMDGYKLCLFGQNIFRSSEDSKTVSMGGLSLGIIKDGELIPAMEGFGCFISSTNDGAGHFCLDTTQLDKYIRNIFTLEDGTPIIEIRYQRADKGKFDKFGIESLFYGVKNGELVRLYSKDCGYDVGDLGELTVDGNSLIDFANAVKYKFNTDTFGGNPFENPNFTKTEFFPEGIYPMYNGQAASQVTLCEKKLSLFGTVKLLALNAEPVTVDGIERVKYSKLFLFLDQVHYSPWAIPIGINGGISGLIASRLDDYLVPITFVNDDGYAEELIAVYQSLDEGSAVREYAVFYDARNGKGFQRVPSVYNGASIPSGDPYYLGTDFTLSHNDWTIILNDPADGEKIVFDFENDTYDVIYPEQ